MFKTFVSAARAAALLGAASSATAWDVSSMASISNLTFQLVDLAPNDGRAPSITFPDGLTWEINSHAINTLTGDAQHFLQNGSFEASTATSLIANTSGATGSAWESGTPFGAAGLVATSAGADQHGHGQGTARTFINFLLSSHTQLIVTGDVFMTGSTSAGGEIAEPAFQFTGSALTSEGWESDGRLLVLTVRAEDGEHPAQPHTRSFSQTVQLVLTNNAGYTIPGYVDASITSNVTSNLVDQVPEPESWTMLIAGLVGIAAFTRSRQSNA